MKFHPAAENVFTLSCLLTCTIFKASLKTILVPCNWKKIPGVVVVCTGVQPIQCSQPRGSLSKMCLWETSAEVENLRSNSILDPCVLDLFKNTSTFWKMPSQAAEVALHMAMGKQPGNNTPVLSVTRSSKLTLIAYANCLRLPVRPLPAVEFGDCQLR